MGRKKLIKRLIYLIFFILIVNFLANKFYWYSSIWWLDIPMHFLGGFWVGLALLYFLSPNEAFRFSLESEGFTAKLVFRILFFVLAVGIGWEIFEILINDAIAQNPFDYLDAISDILFGEAGGALAIFYFFKRIMGVKENTIQ